MSAAPPSSVDIVLRIFSGLNGIFTLMVALGAGWAFSTAVKRQRADLQETTMQTLVEAAEAKDMRLGEFDLKLKSLLASETELRDKLARLEERERWQINRRMAEERYVTVLLLTLKEHGLATPPRPDGC